MLKLKENKGITLIALIITIIVMLILVGVTINVALNGGLFQKAEQAKTQTQKETDQEELQLAVVATLNDDLEIPDANAIKNNLSEGWSVTGPENGVYTCISPKLNEFTVNETDKKITYEGISDGKTEEPKFYGVAYRVESSDPSNYYFFKDGVGLQCYEGSNNYYGFAYTKNGNQLTIMGTPGGILSEYYETITIAGLIMTRNEEAAIDWNKEEAPVVASIQDQGVVSVDLSNKTFQEKGEYRTTIITKDGESLIDYTMTLKIEGGVSSREYVEGQDYSYNSSTGEIVIFNLIEPVTVYVETY